VNRGPIAEIDLSALKHNLSIIRSIVAERTVIAVVKADAYGHGSVEISRNLLKNGISLLAVAFTGEAKTLRTQGIEAGIIVLFDRFDINDYFDYRLTPVIQDLRTAEAFSKEARRRGERIAVHIKVDTGMGRLGFNPSLAVTEALHISEMEGIEVEGLLSHFSEADLSDRSYAVEQLKSFNAIRSSITSRLGRPLLTHMANSAAIFSFRDALLDAVRPGLVLYGQSPFGEGFGLAPVMTVKTRILTVRNVGKGVPVSYGRTFITGRESRIAVIPVGYADGFSRLFSNNAEVLVRGRRVPVVGRVCMDLTMLDVTDAGNVSEDDEVVLLGRQGDDEITATELSSRINTIPYDIVTSLGMRARREYRN
jgi:alanine racemase